MASSSESHGTHDLNFPVEPVTNADCNACDGSGSDPLAHEAALHPCKVCGGTGKAEEAPPMTAAPMLFFSENVDKWGEAVDALQALQARAEAAERELETQFNQHVDDLAKARGESEADKQSIVDLTDRVKELEEALEPFAAITEIPALGCVTKDMVITARTALTGGQ